MAKQTAVQKSTIEENTKHEQVTVMETVEEVKESIGNTIEDNTPEVKENNNSISTPEKENTIKENNTNKAVKIIQKRPSHYSLLMEDGRQVLVHKSLFDRKTMTIQGDI